MEVKRYVKIVALMLALYPALVFGYSDDITHPILSREAIKLFETSVGQTFSATEKQVIINGTVEEDSGVRWLEHFYDPINNRGLSNGRFATSKQWAHGQNSVGNDYTWETAIYDYAYGNKQQGLKALGHILHLLQDKTVPDHTRDDAHPLGCTYESYAKTQTNLFVPASPIYLNSIDDYFDQAANFSNSNFFSDDTILTYYVNPKIEKENWEVLSNGTEVNFGSNNLGKLTLIKRYRNNEGVLNTEYSLSDTDNKVMADYWATLAPKAVGYSAGAIKLFFDEVEKEKLSGELKKARTPWWEKLLELAKIRVDQTLASVGLALDRAQDETRGGETGQTLGTTTDSQIENLPTGERGQTRQEQLAELQVRLRHLRAELEALTGQSEQSILPVIRSVNNVLSSAGALPVLVEDLVLEEATSTATSTATTTEEEILPPEPLAINFSISNCAQSLSPDFCLLKPTSALSFVWSPNKAGDYSYELIKMVHNPDDWDVWDSETVLSSVVPEAVVSLGLEGNDLTKEFKWQVIARSASTSEVVASSSERVTVFHPRPVVINEIGWAGTVASSLDEWLELRNYLRDYTLKLDNYFLTDKNKTWQINLSGQIFPNGYYLIERGSDEVVSNHSANLVSNFTAEAETKAFNPANLGLKLWRKTEGDDELVDETPVWNKTGAEAGSLERTWENRFSTDLSTWEENSGCNDSDGPCALDRNATTTFGTPGVINSASIPRLW
jgi:hypothetical protein